ncbi:MAG: ROK family protein [Actinomycetaceae bacterium]|nr:ROK family protein [Actinomycetaceae bacterium]MDU0970718.1 ROK family protein [Actinomycetaceae bacterium]
MSTPASQPVLVLDIGGTKIAAGIACPTRTGWAVAYSQKRATPANDGGEAVLAQVIQAARDVAMIAEVDGVRPAACGIASAGVIDPATGAVTYASDLMPGWGGVDLARGVAQALGLPTFALNDVHAHALGEAQFGAGQDARRILVVAAGTGLGGALVVDGCVDQGACGIAGSIAHLPHPLAAGMRCACGSTTGHIECVTSGTGQAALYNRNLPAGISPATGGGDVFRRHQAGDLYASAALSDSARALGQTLAGAAALLDPDRIVLTGSATRSGDGWWSALRAGFKGDALPLQSDVALVEGTLGGDAPLIGAAAWVRIRQTCAKPQI